MIGKKCPRSRTIQEIAVQPPSKNVNIINKIKRTIVRKILEMYHRIVYHFNQEQMFNLREGVHMNYKEVTLQMIKKLHDINSWKKLYTFVKVLLEQQGD